MRTSTRLVEPLLRQTIYKCLAGYEVVDVNDAERLATRPTDVADTSGWWELRYQDELPGEVAYR